MRKRLIALTTAALAALAIGAGPAQADTGSTGSGSVNFGSVELGTVPQIISPNSLFLWQSPPTRYIVVLGAKMGTFAETPQILTQRMNAAATLAKQHPLNRVIVSGGDTWWLPVSEAQFMNIGLIKRGVPVWQMINENASTSTVQNAEFTVRMLKGLGATGALIVTNGFHMPRAMKNFRDAAAKQNARLVFQEAYA